MSFLGQSGLNSHPAGAADINAVINANWAVLEGWGNPLHSVTLTQSGTTVTASAAVFFADDVWPGAKILFLTDPNVIVTIVSRTSDTVVEVDISQTIGSATNAFAYPSSADLAEAMFRMMAKRIFVPDGAVLAFNATTKRGDVVGSSHVGSVSTTDATLTDIRAVVLNDDEAATVEALVVARRTNGVDTAGYKIFAVATRATGAASAAVAGVALTVINETDTAWTVDIVADTSGGGYKVQVTGAASKDIDWKVSINSVRT